MISVRKSDERGFAHHGWLESRHSFSFASYYDPLHMGFRSLRVINEDFIKGGMGFGAHPHRDMEIITYVVKGQLEHKDSMGTSSVIQPGEVQHMSAGSGVMHSEFAVAGQDTHLFQIWILPSQGGGRPGYGQKSFDDKLSSENLVLVASGNARDGSIGIKQDADMYIARVSKNKALEFKMRPGRGVWLQVVLGNLEVNGSTARTGDALSFEDENLIKIEAQEASEFILFDLV